MQQLHMMSEALVKYETIDKDQIDDIMAGKEPRPPQDWSDQAPPTGTSGSVSKSEGTGKSDGKIGGPAGEH
jgi:cell division protease FtsH